MLQEIKYFLIKNWWQLIILIPGAFLITFLHELAHAIPVWLQGGTVEEFVWHSDKEGMWGHVSYTFPPSIKYNSFIITIAPYLSALVILTVTFLTTFVIKPSNRIFASFIFICLIVIPLGEIAYALFPYNFYSKKNDLYYAFGNPTLLISFSTIILVIGGTYLAYISHKNIFNIHALSLRSFILLSTIPIFLLAVY